MSYRIANKIESSGCWLLSKLTTNKQEAQGAAIARVKAAAKGRTQAPDTNGPTAAAHNTGRARIGPLGLMLVGKIIKGTSKKPHLVLDSNFSAATVLSKCSRSLSYA